MSYLSKYRREAVLAGKYCGVSLIGFGMDLCVLRVALWCGLEPAWARVISLLCAMHVTFAINGLKVFRCLDGKRFWSQWAGYMTSNGFGNFCNYWIFVTLVSLHWRIVSDTTFALAAGSVCAWLINFAATRFLVFPLRHRRPRADGPQTGPSPASPGSPLP